MLYRSAANDYFLKIHWLLIFFFESIYMGLKKNQGDSGPGVIVEPIVYIRHCRPLFNLQGLNAHVPLRPVKQSYTNPSVPGFAAPLSCCNDGFFICIGLHFIRTSSGEEQWRLV